MFLIYDWPFLHVHRLQGRLLISTVILGSVFSNYVVFYGDNYCYNEYFVVTLMHLSTITPVKARHAASSQCVGATALTWLELSET